MSTFPYPAHFHRTGNSGDVDLVDGAPITVRRVLPVDIDDPDSVEMLVVTDEDGNDVYLFPDEVRS